MAQQLGQKKFLNLMFSRKSKEEEKIELNSLNKNNKQTKKPQKNTLLNKYSFKITDGRVVDG